MAEKITKKVIDRPAAAADPARDSPIWDDQVPGLVVRFDVIEQADILGDPQITAQLASPAKASGRRALRPASAERKMTCSPKLGSARRTPMAERPR